MEEDKITRELKSAEELHRFEASMMLGQTAVYIVATGALLNAIAGNTVTEFNQIGISIFGLALSLVFFLIVHRCGLNLVSARKRAEELNEELDFKLYSYKYRAPKNRFLTGRSATKSICVVGSVFWVVILLKLLV